MWKRQQHSCWAAISWIRPNRRKTWKELKGSMQTVTRTFIKAAALSSIRRPRSQIDPVSRRKLGERHHPTESGAQPPERTNGPLQMTTTYTNFLCSKCNYLLFKLFPTNKPPQGELPEPTFPSSLWVHEDYLCNPHYSQHIPHLNGGVFI